ncbi:MAG: transcription termination factor Rho [Flavobacteriia bacterium]|nr:MAG: transcription termination factor Rho [Flavobacteriia bacterium]
MIQRIQTIYLFIAFIISAIPGWFLSWFTFDENSQNFRDMLATQDMFQIIIVAGFVLVGLLAIISLLSFKNRLFQMRLNRVNIILNLLLFGLLVFYLYKVSGESLSIDSMKGIGVWIPWLSVVFLLLANTTIKKDDNLVKSVDRLR